MAWFKLLFGVNFASRIFDRSKIALLVSQKHILQIVMPSSTQSIALKLVGQLLDHHFVVPSYQRGYRWTERQVTDLLEDLTDFNKHGAPGVRYCLQPIIVKQRGAAWELIDGQQRLTTIYILLNYIKQKALPTAETPFGLEYETRPDSLGFLKKIDPARQNENIDFHYISEAYECISNWMAAQPDSAMAAVELYQVLLKKTGIIWYQVDDTHDPHDIFIRINSGKIPLTNAELVKALFLKRRGTDATIESQEFKQRQMEIANEWNALEAELQRPEIWYFLNAGANGQATHIDFVLNSLAEIRPKPADDYATFRHFAELLADLTTQQVSEEWQKIKNRFLLFQEWFEDRTLYHWIGYLLATGEGLEALVKQASAGTKPAFLLHLQTRIREKVASGTMEGLLYSKPHDKKPLQNILLLFSVETLRQNADASYRFPFHHYKGNGLSSRTWSLEHIHARRDPGFTTLDKFHSWLREARPFVAKAASLPVPPTDKGGIPESTPTQVLASLDAALDNSGLERGDFEKVQAEVFSLFGAPERDDITNLALLTTADNAALSNGLFPQKRAKIIDLERQGSFIPIATRNVFMKYYTPDAGHLSYWTEADGLAYRDAIRATLAEYLPASATTILP